VKQTDYAVILAAGEGKRLRPFTLSNPKCFARVNGQRILDDVLETIEAHGCQVIRIVTDHSATMEQTTVSGCEVYAPMDGQVRTCKVKLTIALLDIICGTTWNHT
jgi:choline kinase